MGDGVCHTVPIIDGYLNKTTVQKNLVAGRELTKAFQKLLEKQNAQLSTSNELEIVKDLKEKHC
jgi:actin-related protein